MSKKESPMKRKERSRVQVLRQKFGIPQDADYVGYVHGEFFFNLGYGHHLLIAGKEAWESWMNSHGQIVDIPWKGREEQKKSHPCDCGRGSCFDGVELLSRCNECYLDEVEDVVSF